MKTNYDTAPSKWEKFKESMGSSGIVGTKLIRATYCAPEIQIRQKDRYKDVEIICDEAFLNAKRYVVTVLFGEKLKAVGRRAFGPEVDSIEFLGAVPEFHPESFSESCKKLTVFVPMSHYDEYVEVLKRLAPHAEVRSKERERTLELEAEEAEKQLQRMRQAMAKAERARRNTSKFKGKLKVTLTSNYGLVCWIESPIWRLPFVIAEGSIEASFTFTPVDSDGKSQAYTIDTPVHELLLPVNSQRRLFDQHGRSKVYNHPKWTLDKGGRAFQRDAADCIIDYNAYDNEQYTFIRTLLHTRGKGTSYSEYHHTFPARMFSLQHGQKLELTYGAALVDSEEFFEPDQIEIPAIDNGRLADSAFYLEAIYNDRLMSRGDTDDYPVFDMIAIGGRFLFLEKVEIHSPSQTKMLIQEYDHATNLGNSHPQTKKKEIPVDEWSREDGERIVHETVSQKKSRDAQMEKDLNESFQAMNNEYGDLIDKYTRHKLNKANAAEKLVNDLINGKVKPASQTQKVELPKPAEPAQVETIEETKVKESVAPLSPEENLPDGEYAEITSDISNADVAVAQVLKLPLDEASYNEHRKYLESSGMWIARVHNPAAPELDFIHSMSNQTYGSALRRLPLRAYSKWSDTPTTIYISRDHKYIKGPVSSALRSRNLVGRALEEMLGRPDKSEGYKPPKPTLLRLFIHDKAGYTTFDMLIDGENAVKNLNPKYMDQILEKASLFTQKDVHKLKELEIKL